ncbi:MAG: hypothetical protein ABIH29_01975 [Candidatus Micrarchaeota archaeon]
MAGTPHTLAGGKRRGILVPITCRCARAVGAEAALIRFLRKREAIREDIQTAKGRSSEAIRMEMGRILRPRTDSQYGKTVAKVAGKIEIVASNPAILTDSFRTRFPEIAAAVDRIKIINPGDCASYAEEIVVQATRIVDTRNARRKADKLASRHACKQSVATGARA